MELISGQGTKFTWGTVSFLLTSVQLQLGSSNNEIDITSMSSKTVQDPENTGKLRVRRDVDAVFDGESNMEVSVEFFAEPWLSQGGVTGMIGLKRDMKLSFPSNEKGEGTGLTVTSKAVLTQMSLGVSTGEFVAGSATFKLSGD